MPQAKQAKLEHIRQAALAPLCLGQQDPPTVDVPDGEPIAINPPPPVVYSGLQGTINQWFLRLVAAIVVARRWPALFSRVTAATELLAFLALQRTLGHQCVNATAFDGQEPWPPEPHNHLHLSAAAAALYEAMRHGPAEVLSAIIDWWAVHFLGISYYWTPGHGFATPCGRALSLPPQWIWDARAYALVMLGEDGDAAKARYGNPAPPSRPAWELFRQCFAQFPAIRERMKSIELKLTTPVRLWKSPNGDFAAILTEDSPSIFMPCAGVVVQGGKIVKSERKVGDFVIPPGEPTIIGAGGTALPPPAPPPQGPPPAADNTAALKAISAQIAAWHLPDKQSFDLLRAKQAALVAELAAGTPTRPLAAIAADVASFGAWAHELADKIRALG
jgi:hypothetical protein